MFRQLSRSIVVAFVLLIARTAHAQEKGQVGVVMGYPAVGIVWTLEDDFAIRTSVDFDFVSDTTDTNTINYDTSTSSLGIDIAVLFYDKRVDSLTMYISPSVGYRRFKTSTDVPILGDLESSASTWQFGGALGAQYSASRRFSIYGEAGLVYGRQTSDFDATSGKGYAIGIRSGAGVILYF
jgi:hypothetical protein